MPTFINIRAPLAHNSNANPLDVIKIKAGLSSLGHYESPDWGISKFPDSALFQAVRDFQKSQGLKVDGVMKPEGETLAALQSRLRGAKDHNATQTAAKALQDLGRGNDEILAHLTQAEAQLLHDVTDGGSINPHTGLLEFLYVSGGDEGVDKSSGSDDNDNNNNGANNGPNFIGNFVEDLKSIFSGTATSPNSAYDERNADAMAAKNNLDRRHYLPGGKYGPGGASYNPFALHNAGVEMQTAAPGSLDKYGYDWDSAVTTQALPNILGEVAAPSVKTGAPAVVTQTMPDKTPAVAPANQTGAQTNTKAQDLRAELAQAESAAWQSGQTPTQQAANIHKIESLREEIKKVEDAEAQKSQQAQLGNFDDPLQEWRAQQNVFGKPVQVAEGGILYSDPNDPGPIYRFLEEGWGFGADIYDRATNPAQNTMSEEEVKEFLKGLAEYAGTKTLAGAAEIGSHSPLTPAPAKSVLGVLSGLLEMNAEQKKRNLLDPK